MSKDKRKLTSSDRAMMVRTFFKFGREYPSIWRFTRTNVSFHNFFESRNIFIDKLDFSDIDKAIDWVYVAMGDIDAARKLYKSVNRLALYHLQQSVEKLLKACLIFTGFKTESNVINLNHKPQKFAIELINDPDIKKTIYDYSPFPKVKKLKKPSDTDVDKLVELVNTNDKLIALEKGDDMIKGVSLLLGTPNPLTYDPNEISELVKEILEKKIDSKELKRFKKSCDEKSIGYNEMIYNGSNFCYIAINMSMILLPLAIGLYPFESTTRYPDELRKLDKNIEEYHAYSAFDTIVSQVDKFAEFFMKFLESEIVDNK